MRYCRIKKYLINIIISGYLYILRQDVLENHWSLHQWRPFVNLLIIIVAMDIMIFKKYNSQNSNKINKNNKQIKQENSNNNNNTLTT